MSGCGQARCVLLGLGAAPSLEVAVWDKMISWLSLEPGWTLWLVLPPDNGWDTLVKASFCCKQSVSHPFWLTELPSEGRGWVGAWGWPWKCLCQL